jgi:streptomycin 6-kinase
MGGGARRLRRRARRTLSGGFGSSAPCFRRGCPLNLPWDLELGDPFHAPFSKLVAPARLPDGTEVVVKIHVDDDVESVHEPEALRFWHGRGAVRLIDYDPKTRAMLIERCLPGTPLGNGYDDASLEVVARTLQRLWRPPSGNVPWRRLADVAEEWVERLPFNRERHGRPYERRLLDEALDALRVLGPSQRDLVLCHQDLHGGNILSAQREPWLAIDSKPIVAEPAYDVVPAVRDLDEHGRITAAEMRRRLDRLSALLGVDRERVRRWTIAKHLAWATGSQYFPYEVEMVRAAVEVGSGR